MAQQHLENCDTPLFSNTDLSVDELKPGLCYPDENTAVEAVLKWGKKAFCPLAKARRDKGLSESDGHKKGRRHLDCPHGRSRKGSTSEARPVQNVKFTKCPVRVVLVENDDGSWSVAKTILDHFGHTVSKKDYYAHEHTKRLEVGGWQFFSYLGFFIPRMVFQISYLGFFIPWMVFQIS